MSNLKFNIDAAAIASAFKELALEVEQDLQRAVGDLAAMTHAKTSELAQNKLKSSREQYMKALSWEEISPGIWVVSLDQDALWIEEGLPPGFDMKPGLLKEGKTSADGTRYRVVPFDHGKAPNTMTAKAQEIVKELKQNLKDQKVPFKKIELNKDGSPKRGLIHEFDFGGEKPGKGNTPVLNGVSIYQSTTKTGNVRRDIMTFRTVTDKQTDKWIHPGNEAKKFMDEALEWATQKWETEILPEILKKYEGDK